MAVRTRDELLGWLPGCFARTQTWLHAGRYVAALVSGLPKRNGWTIAEQAGDRTPDRTQRLLNRAIWNTAAVMSRVRRFAVAGLDAAAGRGRRRGLRVGALDETGQQKQGASTAGVKRQYLGCAGRVANGINTVHLSYVREHIGHALIGARQWIPAGHLDDPATADRMGLPAELVFRTKGQLAIDLLTDAAADGVAFDVICGDEVYGACTPLREFCQDRRQAYVLRVASTFLLTLPSGDRLTCAQAVNLLAADTRRWQVRSAGTGSKGPRWYAWALIATASDQHQLLVRRHLSSGELAFHYCHIPAGQTFTAAQLIRPVEDRLRPVAGRPRPPIHPPRQLVTGLREIAPSVDLADLPPMLEPRHFPHQIVPHHRRRLPDGQLLGQILEHRLRHIRRVIQERAHITHRGQLQRKPQPTRPTAVRPYQLQIGVVQEEVPLKILNRWDPSKPPVPVRLLGRQEPDPIVIDHQQSTYVDPGAHHSHPIGGVGLHHENSTSPCNKYP